jgi:hypothetical protein
MDDIGRGHDCDLELQTTGWMTLAQLLDPGDDIKDSMGRASEAGTLEAVVNVIKAECQPGFSKGLVQRRVGIPKEHGRSRNVECKLNAVEALMKLVTDHQGNQRRFIEAKGLEALRDQGTGT